MRRDVRILLIAGLGLGAAGCGDDASGSGVCEAQAACACADGAPGVQVCGVDGGLDECFCSTVEGTSPEVFTPAPVASAGINGMAGSVASVPQPTTPGASWPWDMTDYGEAAGAGSAAEAPMASDDSVGSEAQPAAGSETESEPEMEAEMASETGNSPASGAEVPDNEQCADVAEWDPAWSEFEEEVLRLSNEARAVGHNCDTEGQFGPADPLTMNAALRCSARLHSMDMGENDYFSHTGLSGSDAYERMMAAGYVGFLFGENIAKGQQSPREVVDGWLDSDGHCANLLNPDFQEIGIGYWEGEATNQWFNDQKLWTQNFGASGGDNCFWCP